VNSADVMFTPGPKRSTQEPKFEKLARASLMSLAATVMGFAALAGALKQAFGCRCPRDRIAHAVRDGILHGLV